MALRNWLRKLERLSEDEQVVIPQRDGTVKRFPRSDLMEAYRNLYARHCAGEDVPPDHPLLEAVRNSSDPEWSGTALAEEPEAWVRPVEDLSE